MGNTLLKMGNKKTKKQKSQINVHANENPSLVEILYNQIQINEYACADPKFARPLCNFINVGDEDPFGNSIFLSISTLLLFSIFQSS